MHHDILRDVCSDKHLSIIVVVHPVLCTDGIADWIWAYKLAIDNALHLERIEQVHHESGPVHPVTHFSVVKGQGP